MNKIITLIDYGGGDKVNHIVDAETFSKGQEVKTLCGKLLKQAMVAKNVHAYMTCTTCFDIAVKKANITKQT